MILVYKFTDNDFFKKRNQIIKCLNKNKDNNIFFKIIIFLDSKKYNLIKGDKIKYIIKPNFNFFDINNYMYKAYNFDYILSSDPIEFPYDFKKKLNNGFNTTQYGNFFFQEKKDVSYEEKNIRKKNYIISCKKIKNNFKSEKSINKENSFKPKEKINQKNIFKKSYRDKNIKPKLAVITTFYNPNDYINLKYNYLKFSEKIKEKADLFPIELSFDGNFFIEDENVIRIKGKKENILWQKERLLNIALEKLPKEYTNVAWIDCDILFDNENWVEEVNEKLKKYKILQLFDRAKRLDRYNNIDQNSISIVKRSIDKNNINPINGGVPGFAWAIRREVIEKIKFLDTQIIGGGDFLMYLSSINHIDNFLTETMNSKWVIAYKKWAYKALKEVNYSINNISGNITHLYHGSMPNRNYQNRYKILNENNYDPKKDLTLSKNKLWKLNNKSIIKGMNKYFIDRKEDDNILDINTYFDNIYVLNLDRQRYKMRKIDKKMKKLNIKYERFSGIDGKNISDYDYDFSDYEQGKGMIENKYALCCMKSHLSIIQDAKNNGYKKILIFEDDVLISKDIKAHFQKLRNIQNWKLLYFGSSQYNWDVEYIEDFYYSNNSLGTFAYALDSSIYDHILNANNDKAIDSILAKIQSKNEGQCYTFFPFVCISDVTKSNIRNPRNQENHSIRMKWNMLKNYI